MKKLFLILILLLVGSCSAITISSQSITVTPPSTTLSAIVLDSAPNGLSGCNVTVTVANTSVASIQSISYPAWASPYTNSTLPANSVTFTAADFSNLITAGATNTPLAYIAVNGVAVGSSDLTVTVTECDDDSGNPMSPSASSGTATVLRGSGANTTAPYQLPPVPFPKLQIGGIHMISASVNSTTHIVNLTGRVDNMTTDPQAWFVIGDPSNLYSYFTVAYPPNSTGYVVIPFGTGAPLMPGEVYYVRLASQNGESVEEISFTTPAATPLPTSNFSQYFYNIQYTNHSPLAMLAAVPLPLVDLFGAGNAAFGWQIFFTIVFGILCLVLVVRHDSIVLVFEGICIAAVLMLGIIDPEFIWIIFAFCAIAAATILYRLYRRE